MIFGFNILLSSAGHRVDRVKMFRDMVQSLPTSGNVYTSDVSPLSAAGRAAYKHHIVPRCNDPAFIPTLFDLCNRTGLGLIVPGIDPELPILAAASDQFAEDGMFVLISSPETVAIGRDKRQTHAWLVDNGFPTVPTGSLDDALANPGQWPLPLIAKPAAGSASVGVRKLTTRQEVEELATSLGPQRSDYIVQTIATGSEYTVDVLVNLEGECVCAVPRRRIEVRSGEVFKGMTAKNPALMQLAAKIAESLPGAWGPLNIQMFHDAATGETNVIEINPRFGGGFTLAYKAGADFPRWIAEELLGLRSTVRFDAWQDNLVMLRHYAAKFATADQLGGLNF